MRYTDYAGLSNTADQTVTISSRTRALILSAIFYIEPRFVWGDATDAQWDEIQDWIAQAAQEISE